MPSLKAKLAQKLNRMETKRSSSSDDSSTSLGSSPNNDALINDVASSTAECELLKIYDTCQKSLPAEHRIFFPQKKKSTVPIAGESVCPCFSEGESSIPPSPPTKWPQRPILLRPSPDSSGMRIIGIRYSSSKEYLPLMDTGFCKGCTLPINNGHEQTGKCLVIDFETDLFIGTAMLRVRNIPAPLLKSSHSKHDAIYSKNNSYYFSKKKRTFQATVRGQFKQQGIPMSECVTGQIFDRPAGYLPPRLIVKGAVSIISHLAPQLQARLEGDCPRFLSPLVSTAQTVIVQSCDNDGTQTNQIHFNGADMSIEDNIYEPQASNPSSTIQSLIKSGAGEIIGVSSVCPDKSSVAHRIKSRKKAFDKLFAQSIKVPTFDVNKEYVFEFFQHLITFDDFSLDFVKPIGKHSLHGMLNGQPLKFMAAHQNSQNIDSEDNNDVQDSLNWLWCFEVWHECLYQEH
jgi:hypothetical protein